MKKIEMPKMGDTMEEGKILRWIKKEGDQVKKGEAVAEVETDKVNIEIEAFAGGMLRKILVPVGNSAPIGATIALVGTADEPLPDNLDNNGGTTRQTTSGTADSHKGPRIPTQPPLSLRDDLPSQAPQAHSQKRVFISPLARRMAQENNLDYVTLKGTGPNGRIIKLDIEAALARQTPGRGQAVAPTGVAEPMRVETDEVVEIPLTAMRRTIARRLSQSMQTAPHFYVTSVIDMEKLAALREQINGYVATESAPIKVSLNDLIVKAVAKALVRVPRMNVSFAEDRLLQKKRVHIGVAVALEDGLIVPVLRDVDRLGVLEIARESRRLTEAARAGKLRPEDMTGGTFTVSNLGMFDVESFTAVINPPESAILAVGAMTPTPVVVDGEVVVRRRMKVTLSSDHRAIDGAIAAHFLQEVKRLLEEPFGLLL